MVRLVNLDVPLVDFPAYGAENTLNKVAMLHITIVG